MWDLISLLVLGGLIILGFGISIGMIIWKDGAGMLRKIKSQTSGVTSPHIDTALLVDEIASRVTNAVLEKLLDKISPAQYSQIRNEAIEELVKIDESIIPMAVEVNAEQANVEGMTKEQVEQDEQLSSAKAKLADLLKKKEQP